MCDRFFFFLFFTSGGDGLDEEETDKHQNEDRRLHFLFLVVLCGCGFRGFIFFFAVELMRFFVSGEVATHLNISSSFRPRPNDPPSMSALFSFPLTIKQFETKQKFPLALPL